MNMKELIDQYQSNGELSAEIIEKYLCRENEVLQLFQKLTKSDNNFFSAFYVLESFTKKLDFDARDLFECCLHLTQEAEEDIASSEPKRIYIDYLIHCPYKLSEFFESILLDDYYNEFLDWFLLAGYQIDENTYLQLAMTLLERHDKKLLDSVLFSLSRVQITDVAIIGEILDKLLSLLAHADIDIGTQSLRFITSLNGLKDELLDKAMPIVNIILKEIDDELIHNVACLLQISDNLSKNIESKLVDVILQVNIENLGTLDRIDWWLYKLASANEINKVISFVTHWNQKRSTILNLQFFKHFLGFFYHKPDKLNYLITSIFLSQNYLLMASFGKAWADLIRNSHIAVDKELIRSAGRDKPALYLSKKAYGWLFLYAESMVAYVFSLLPYVKKTEQSEMKEVLRFIALSYPTLFNSFFEKSVKKNKKNQWLWDENEKVDEYFTNIEELKPIHEVRISKENRLYRQILFQENMSKYERELHQDGFLSFISRQVILYGRGSITQIEEFPRQESILQKISSNSYLPIALSLDLHNHSQILKKYKEEDCKELEK